MLLETSVQSSFPNESIYYNFVYLLLKQSFHQPALHRKYIVPFVALSIAQRINRSALTMKHITFQLPTTCSPEGFALNIPAWTVIVHARL
jgi:hypothetical protein